MLSDKTFQRISWFPAQRERWMFLWANRISNLCTLLLKKELWTMIYEFNLDYTSNIRHSNQNLLKLWTIRLYFRCHFSSSSKAWYTRGKDWLGLVHCCFPKLCVGALYMIKNCNKLLLCGWMNGSHLSNLFFTLLWSYIKHATQSMMLMTLPRWSQNHQTALLANVILELQPLLIRNWLPSVSKLLALQSLIVSYCVLCPLPLGKSWFSWLILTW